MIENNEPPQQPTPEEAPSCFFFNADPAELNPTGVLLELLKFQREVDQSFVINQVAQPTELSSYRMLAIVHRALGGGLRPLPGAINDWHSHKISGKPDIDYLTRLGKGYAYQKQHARSAAALN